MFGRTVIIDGKAWVVMCSPKTPFSEVLESASRMAKREEDAAREADPNHQAYRRAIEAHTRMCF